MDIFKVIKCDGKDCGNDVFVWKFPGEDFNTLSQLIVHESQEAIFLKTDKRLIRSDREDIHYIRRIYRLFADWLIYRLTVNLRSIVKYIL